MTRPERRRFTPALVATGMLLAVSIAAPAPADDTVRTGKERLGTKASDPQRVDDCKVAPALRDPAQPRPTDCGRRESVETSAPATDDEPEETE